MEGSTLLLADEFFLTAHDDTGGRPRLSDRVLGIGLASAMLAELIFLQRLTVEGGLLTVVDRHPVGESLAASLMDQLADEPHHRSVRDWISYLAATAEDAVGRRLARLGHVRRKERRRLLGGTKVTYEPVNMNVAAWPGVRLHLALDNRSPLSDHDVVLAGLVLATGLDQQVLWNLDQEARQDLLRLFRYLSPPLRELLAYAEAAVGEAVISRRV